MEVGEVIEINQMTPPNLSAIDEKAEELGNRLCFLHGLSQTEGVLKSCYLKSTFHPYQQTTRTTTEEEKGIKEKQN